MFFSFQSFSLIWFFFLSGERYQPACVVCFFVFFFVVAQKGGVTVRPLIKTHLFLCLKKNKQRKKTIMQKSHKCWFLRKKIKTVVKSFLDPKLEQCLRFCTQVASSWFSGLLMLIYETSGEPVGASVCFHLVPASLGLPVGFRFHQIWKATSSAAPHLQQVPRFISSCFSDLLYWSQHKHTGQQMRPPRLKPPQKAFRAVNCLFLSSVTVSAPPPPRLPWWICTKCIYYHYPLLTFVWIYLISFEIKCDPDIEFCELWFEGAAAAKKCGRGWKTLAARAKRICKNMNNSTDIGSFWTF